MPVGVNKIHKRTQRAPQEHEEKICLHIKKGEVPARLPRLPTRVTKYTVAVPASNSRESWSLSGSLSG